MKSSFILEGDSVKSVQTKRMKSNFAKEISVNTVSPLIIADWLRNGLGDFLRCPGLAIFYGLFFWGMSFGIWSILSTQETMHDVSGPLLAIIILIFGPISAMSLYSASQKIQSGEEISLKSLHEVIGATFVVKGSCPSIFLSLLLVILGIAWMIFTPLIYAIFNANSLHIVGESQHIIDSITQSLLQGSNIPYLIVYGVFTAVLAWIAFMISWFSFPMVLDQDVDPFTAAIASFKTSISNIIVMLVWIPIVGALVLLALLTPYFIGLIVVIPLLAHSTWHAYKSLIGEMREV